MIRKKLTKEIYMYNLTSIIVRDIVESLDAEIEQIESFIKE